MHCAMIVSARIATDYMAAYTTLPVALQGRKRAFNTLNSSWLSAAPSQTHHNFPSAITVPAAPSPSEFYHHHCRQSLSVPIAFGRHHPTWHQPGAIPHTIPPASHPPLMPSLLLTPYPTPSFPPYISTIPFSLSTLPPSLLSPSTRPPSSLLLPARPPSLTSPSLPPPSLTYPSLLLPSLPASSLSHTSEGAASACRVLAPTSPHQPPPAPPPTLAGILTSFLPFRLEGGH